MDVLACIICFGAGMLLGYLAGFGLFLALKKVREEYEKLKSAKEEELKELEARVERKARQEPDELSLLLMKEQRLAYEAEEERAKKRAAGTSDVRQ